MKRKTTGSLMRELKSFDRFESYLEVNRDVLSKGSTSDLLLQLLERKGLSRSQVAKRSGLNEIYAYQVLAGKRIPSRDKLLCLGIAMKLTVDELQGLLKSCGYAALYPRRKRDAVILFVLKSHGDVISVNEELFAQGEKPLC